MTDQSSRPALDSVLRRFSEVSALWDPHRLRIWDQEGLTVTQLRLLLWVSEKEGISNAELAERLYVTRPSVSALLDRLERGGFIRREISPTDRRGICVWLEDRGRNAITSLIQAGNRYGSDLFGALTDQQLEQIASALEKLVAVGREGRVRQLLAEQAVEPVS